MRDAWDKAAHYTRHAARAEARAELARDIDEVVQLHDALIGALDRMRRALELQRQNYAQMVPRLLVTPSEPGTG